MANIALSATTNSKFSNKGATIIPPNNPERIGLASIGEILQVSESRRCDSLKQACAVLRNIRQNLQELNVERIIIAYDGYADSGCVENITAMNGNDQVELPEELRAVVKEAAYGLLPLGWENENGSVGELIINVRSRHIKREHNWRIEDTQYEEREILF